MEPLKHPRQILLEALAFHQRGQLEAARPLYDAVIRLQPQNGDALHLRGVIAAQSGNPSEAAAFIAKAVAVNPQNPVFHANLGNALNDLGQPQEAVLSFETALALQPDFVDVHYNLGNALKALEKYPEAAASYGRAVALVPDHADAHLNRGLVFAVLKDWNAAAASFVEALRIRPDFAAAHYNLGLAQNELGDFQGALASYDAAIAHQPDFAEAHLNRGIVLKRLGRNAEAIQSYDRAIALRPGFAEAYSSRGNALKHLGKLAEAADSFEQAIALQPDFIFAKWNKALVHLTAGELEKGWGLYEWRWHVPQLGLTPRAYDRPRWTGKEPLQGRSILIHAEQGMGDTIQFCRYLKLLSDRGAATIFEVPAPLAALMKTLDGAGQVIPQGAPLPAYDFHCPLLSLPGALGTTMATIPSGARYLAADPAKSAAWKDTLGPRTKPRLGIVWSSVSAFGDDYLRSVTLKEFLTAIPRGKFEVICLQKEIKDSDRQTLAENPEVNFCGDRLKDFSDTAALIDNLDMVVGTCTSVPHLAAALGKPTWILLSFMPDWRWFLGTDGSPWYPTVRLYRQAASSAWPDVFHRVRQDLERFAGTGAAD